MGRIGRPILATELIGTQPQVVWEARYLPFGSVEIVTGASSSYADIRFPGQWFQSEHGLHQNWMRDYDPVTGRYLQADPLGLVDGASIYGYALQDPMRYTDPTGEFVPALIGFGLAVWDGYKAGTLIGEAINGINSCDGLTGWEALGIGGGRAVGMIPVLGSRQIARAGSDLLIFTAQSDPRNYLI